MEFFPEDIVRPGGGARGPIRLEGKAVDSRGEGEPCDPSQGGKDVDQADRVGHHGPGGDAGPSSPPLCFLLKERLWRLDIFILYITL